MGLGQPSYSSHHHRPHPLFAPIIITVGWYGRCALFILVMIMMATIVIGCSDNHEDQAPKIFNSKFLALNFVDNYVQFQSKSWRPTPKSMSLMKASSAIHSDLMMSSDNRLQNWTTLIEPSPLIMDDNINDSTMANIPTTTSAFTTQASQNKVATATITSREPDIEYVLFRDNTRFWVQRVLVPIITIIGVVGNSITIIIMTRRRMRSSTNWYLAALAIFDMVYLIFTFILSLKHYPNAHSDEYRYYWYFFPWSTMIADAASNTSVWITVTFTIERYIAVCHPIRGKVICTESRAKKVILCVFIICLSFTLPTPFEWVVVKRLDPITKETVWEAVFSELGRNETYKNIYYHLTVFFFVLLPLILLVIFNSFLIRSVHISKKQRSQMIMGKDKIRKTPQKVANNNNNNNLVPSPSQASTTTTTSNPSSSSSSYRQEMRITIMLIAVVILFIICQTPTAFILVYTAFHQLEPQSNQMCLLVGLSNIFNFLMSINSAGNFVLYCLLSQKYRRTFVKMFCRCLPTENYVNRANTDFSTAASHKQKSFVSTKHQNHHRRAHHPESFRNDDNNHHNNHNQNLQTFSSTIHDADSVSRLKPQQHRVHYSDKPSQSEHEDLEDQESFTSQTSRSGNSSIQDPGSCSYNCDAK